MKHNIFETVLGFCVLCVAGLFLYMVYVMNTSSLSSGGYMLKAKFDKADGISIGSDIRLAGIKIGTVNNVNIDAQTYQALISFSVKDTLQIPSDSSAEIVSDGLLGGKYINISPGGSPEYLEKNDMIEMTQSSISLEQLLGKFLFSSSNDKKEA